MGKDFQTNKYQTFLTCVFFLLAGAAYKMPDSFLAFFIILILGLHVTLLPVLQRTVFTSNFLVLVYMCLLFILLKTG